MKSLDELADMAERAMRTNNVGMMQRLAHDIKESTNSVRTDRRQAERLSRLLQQQLARVKTRTRPKRKARKKVVPDASDSDSQ